MAEDDKKTPDPEGTPPSETLLETEQRDPDEAVLAEQAIHSYSAEALDQFRQQVETALGNVTAWVDSQGGKLDAGAIGPQLGDAFLKQMVSAGGGMQAPIGAAMHDQLDSEIDSLVRDEQEAGRIVDGMATAARDFTWYLRDNLQSVLSHEWDQLRDLAYEGSTDFIAALHACGMPKMDFDGAGLESGLIAVGETKLGQQPKTEDEAIERDPEQEQAEQQQALVAANEKTQATV